MNYISKEDYANLNDDWTNNSSHNFYFVQDENINVCEDFKLPNIGSNHLFESRIKIIPYRTKSNELAKQMLMNLVNSDELATNIKGQTFKVSYYDKFNQSEFSMRMMLQFINQIKDESALISIADLSELKSTINAFVFDILGLENVTKEESGTDKLSSAVALLINLRQEARANKDFAMSDKIRDELAAAGIQLKDGKDGTTFSTN